MLTRKGTSRLPNAFLLVLVLRLFDGQRCVELVGGNLVEGKGDAEPEGSSQIKGPAQELAGLRVLCGKQPVQRAFLTAASVIR